MFSNDDKISDINDLLHEVKDYADLRLQKFRLDFVSKLTMLLSALVVSVVLLVIFAVVLLFLAYTFALTLAPHVGGLHWACAVIALGCVCLGCVFYAFRRQLILKPMTNFIAHLFLDKEKSRDEENKEEEQNEAED